mgnify:CR=1 FL=1
MRRGRFDRLTGRALDLVQQPLVPHGVGDVVQQAFEHAHPRGQQSTTLGWRTCQLQRQLVEAQARLRLYKDGKGAVSAGQVTVSPGPSPAPPQSQAAGPGNNGEPRRVADLERHLETATREAERQIDFEQKRSAMLEAENRRLREGQEEVVAMLADKSASGRSGDWRPWHVSLLAALLLLSFVAGIAFKNYRIYRRYGKHRL